MGADHHATDAERTVLGEILFDPECLGIVREILTPGDFHQDKHRRIFATMIDLANRGDVIDLITLEAQLSRSGDLERIGGAAYLVELSSDIFTSINAKRHAELVLEAANRRRIDAALCEALSAIRKGEPVDLSRIQELASTPTPTVKASRFISAVEFLQEDVAVEYFIHGLIETDTTGQLFGPSGGGKTFVALDMTLAGATGGTWAGRAAKQGIVLYLAGEGHHGLRRRVRAWQTYHGINVELFHVSRNTIDFDGTGLGDVRAEAQQLEEIHGVPIVLIVIDTLSRHLPGDENSTKDMSAFIRSVDSLRAAFPGSVALIVHHTGHGEDSKGRARGSSALRAAMDFEIQCNAGLLTFTKMKDCEAPQPIEFKLMPVEIGTDQDGKPITSCVVAYGERSERYREAELTTMERFALKVLTESSTDGEMLIGDWREAFYNARREMDPDAKTNTLKKAFLRAVEGLESKGAIKQSDNTILLPNIQPGHGTKTGQKRDMSRGKGPGHGTHPYKGCPDVPLSCPVPEYDPGYLDSLLEGEPCPY